MTALYCAYANTNAIGTSASALFASPGGSVGAEASALAKSMASTEKRMDAVCDGLQGVN
jgi:hypothetical protein